MPKPLQNIVCIDDERDILEITRLSLETVGGFTVTTFSSSSEALSRLVSLKPDILIVDFMMPEMGGLETLDAVRKLPGDVARTPVIFMTARAQPGEIQECLDKGVSGVIVKPFDPMNLANEVKEIWAKARTGE